MRPKAGTVAALAALVAALIIVAIGTRGFTALPPATAYFDELATAFFAGQTSLLVQPAPQLLASPDPFAAANAAWWRYDISLYQGKFYLYWSPLPALIPLFFKSVAAPFTISDGMLTVFFVLVRIGFGALLLNLCRKRLFRRAKLWTTAFAVLVFALAAPMATLVSRPFVYEAGVAGGQCFLVGGLWLLYVGLFSGQTVRSRRIALALGGVCLASAFACRLSLMVAAFGLIALAVIAAARRAPRPSIASVAAVAACVGTPSVVTAGVMALYNYVRFGNLLDSGVRYQMTYYPYAASLKYVAYNLFIYLMRPPAWRPTFPFIEQSRVPAIYPAPSWINTPTYYYPSMMMVGAVYVVPFIAFALAGPLARPAAYKTQATAGERRWLAASCWTIVVLGGAPLLVNFASTLRYFGDVSSALVILALMGVWRVDEALRLRPWLRRGWLSFAVGAAAVSSLAGILVGFGPS